MTGLAKNMAIEISLIYLLTESYSEACFLISTEYLVNRLQQIDLDEFLTEKDYLTKTRHCSVQVSPFSVVRNSYNGGMQTIDKKSMKHAAFTFTFMEVDVAV